MLGAEAVQVGTRFLVARECTVHENYKKKVLEAKDIDTVVTGRRTGHPVRVIRNKLSRKFMELDNRLAPLEEYDKLGTEPWRGRYGRRHGKRQHHGRTGSGLG